jgi:hypothetical protein
MSAIRAVDCSAYQGAVSAETFRQLRALGVTAFVPQVYGSTPDGTGPNPYLAIQTRNALAAGLAVPGGYVWPSWGWPQALAHWQRTLPDLPLRFLALDVEADAPVHPDQVRDLRSRGIEPVIYTSWSQWERIMGDSPYYSWFAENGVPVWVAYYPSRDWAGDWPNTHLPPAYVPRPWAARPGLVVGWQFRGTTPVAGSQFDLNVFSPLWRPLWELPGGPLGQPETKEEVIEMLKCVHLPAHGYAALLWGGVLWVWHSHPAHEAFARHFPEMQHVEDNSLHDLFPRSGVPELAGLGRLGDLPALETRLREAIEASETELKAEVAVLSDRLSAIEAEMARARGVLGAAKSVLDWLLSFLRRGQTA